MPELHTVSLFKPLTMDAGRIRISVISRPTLDDGITPDERIIKNITHHEWLREFAPQPKLVGSFKRNEIGWEEYEREYLTFLRTIREKVKLLSNRCLYQKITLSCVEDEAIFCHRRLLAEELQRHQPSLIIIHK